MPAIIAAIIAGGATIAGGALAADSQKDAAETNRKASEATNAANLYQYQLGRGLEGNAILPIYGGTTEKELFDSARGLFADIRPTPQLMSDIASYRNRLMPTFGAGTETIESIYDDRLTKQRIAQAQPVAQARSKLARSSRAAIIEGLKERLNAIQAGNVRRGFSGSGTASELPLLRATVGARGAAAREISAADLENALMMQSIQDQGVDLKLRSLDLPVSRVQQYGALQNLPAQAMSDAYLNAVRPFSFFNIGPQAFRYEPPPPYPAIPGLGAIVASGLGGVAGGVGNILANNRMADQFSAMQLGNIGGTVPQNWNGMSPAQQQQYINAARWAAQNPGSGYE